MSKSKKLLSLLLALLMTVSLLSGALAVGAADDAAGEGFVKTDAIEAGKETLIVTEYEGRYYALALPAGSSSGTGLTAEEVTVAGDAIAAANDTAIFGSSHVEDDDTTGFIHDNHANMVMADGHTQTVTKAGGLTFNLVVPYYNN